MTEIEEKEVKDALNALSPSLAVAVLVDVKDAMGELVEAHRRSVNELERMIKLIREKYSLEEEKS